MTSDGNPDWLDLRYPPGSIATQEIALQVLTLEPSTQDAPLLPDMKVLLQFLSSGTCVALPLVNPLILGRDARAVNILDLTEFHAMAHGVSRHHCRLARWDNSLVVVDLDSTNGTYLNRERLAPYHEYVVADGARLILGSLHIVIAFSSSY